MTEDTQQITKPNSVESHIGGVSVRGWIVVMVMGTMCIREIAVVVSALYEHTPVEQVKEPFYGVVMGLIGFYFGQKTTPTPTK